MNNKLCTKYCKFCGNIFHPFDIRRKYCSTKCASSYKNMGRLKTKTDKISYIKYIKNKKKILEERMAKSKNVQQNITKKKNLVPEIKNAIYDSKNIELDHGACGIYIILNNINNKFYIGSSNDLKRRKTFHFSRLRNNKHFNKHLQNAWNKYGEFNFIFRLLYSCEERNLEREEESYINRLESFKREIGYNKTRNCIASPMKGLKGKDNPLFGRKRPKEIMNPARGASHYRARAILQKDFNDNIISEFGCISDAAREIMSDECCDTHESYVKNLYKYVGGIGRCCKSKKLKSYAGFRWDYKT